MTGARRQPGRSSLVASGTPRKKKAGRPALDNLSAGRIGPAVRGCAYFSVLDEDGTVT
jgi:hypothetical protein